CSRPVAKMTHSGALNAAPPRSYRCRGVGYVRRQNENCWCFSEDSAGNWSVNQLAQIIHNQMRTMVLKLLGIPLARNANHKSEVPVKPSRDSRDGILDDNCPCRLNPE